MSVFLDVLIEEAVKLDSSIFLRDEPVIAKVEQHTIPVISCKIVCGSSEVDIICFVAEVCTGCAHHPEIKSNGEASENFSTEKRLK